MKTNPIRVRTSIKPTECTGHPRGTEGWEARDVNVFSGARDASDEPPAGWSLDARTRSLNERVRPFPSAAAVLKQLQTVRKQLTVDSG